MKRTSDIKAGWLHFFILCLCLPAGITACAPPQATDAQLRSQLSQMQNEQQQLLEQLGELQEELTELRRQQSRPEPTAAVPEPQVSEEVGEEPTAGISTPATDVIPVLAESATLYLEAFSALALGRYQQAAISFEDFLSRYAEHEYAPNARYWLAETQLARGMQQQAEANLLLVGNSDNSSGKAPAALGRLVELYRQQNKQEQADTILQKLSSRFPGSREAQLFNRGETPQ